MDVGARPRARPDRGGQAVPRSRVKADDYRLRARNQRLLVGGPTAVGYFLGFRIIEAYAAHHGAASWIDAMDLPAREVLVRSGYRF